MRLQSEPTFDMAQTTDTELTRFFERPFRIATTQWNQGFPLSISFAPLNTMAFDKRVGNKWTGYRYLRGTLCVKFQISGSPFHYGRVIAAWTPFQSSQTNVPETAELAPCALSQRPHVFLDPSSNQGGVIKVPILWPLNGVDITVNDNLNKVGRIHMVEVNPLKHANASVESVTIQTWAWLEDVVLSVPTAKNAGNLAPQMYEGAVSKPANTVAAVAGKLKTVPGIGPYAKATEMGAKAVAGVANVFGYSKPKDIGYPNQVVPRLMGNMSQMSGVETCQSLTGDPKQELTIDPVTMGLPSVDEMTIQHIAGKESYVGQFSWSSANAADATLVNLLVRPLQFMKEARPGLSDAYLLSSLAFAALPFEYWRGTLKFRFQVVASKYHRGKLRFYYDPLGSMNSSTDENMVYNRIVDITSEQDFTMEIGWGTEYPWLTQVGVEGQKATTEHTSADFDELQDNGMISVSVMNPLQSADDSADVISVNVFVSAGDDFEVAVPTTAFIRRMSYFPDEVLEPQSAEEIVSEMNDAPVDDSVEESFLPKSRMGMSQDVFFADPIPSFRSVIKRTVRADMIAIPSTGVKVTSILMPHRPLQRGFDPEGIHGVPLTNPYNYSTMNFLTYLMPAYAVYRGSIRWKTVIFNSSEGFDKLPVTVELGNITDLKYEMQTMPHDSTPRGYVNSKDTGGIGMIGTLPKINPVLDFEVPFYSHQRFFLPRILSSASAASGFNQFERPHKYVISNAGASLERYVAAGEDFMCAYHIGAPYMYFYEDPVL